MRALFLFGSLTLLLVGGQTGRGESPNPAEAIRDMVNAEKEFYQAGQKKGTRAAFLNFLAEDAIVFRPGPINGREAWQKKPETGLDLIWEPTFAAMARSADLGYTTGPAKWRANKKEETFSGYGQFISIWKRQKDGTWKVAVDCGIENPDPKEEPGVLKMALPSIESPAQDQRNTARKISEVQQQFVTAAEEDAVAALLAVASDEIRVYREGNFPAVGKAATRTLLETKPGKVTFEPMGGGASNAEDLVYSYGKYASIRKEGNESGYYFHIWQTNGDTWKLVVDWAQPLPKEKQ